MIMRVPNRTTRSSPGDDTTPPPTTTTTTTTTKATAKKTLREQHPHADQATTTATAITTTTCITIPTRQGGRNGMAIIQMTDIPDEDLILVAAPYDETAAAAASHHHATKLWKQGIFRPLPDDDDSVSSSLQQLDASETGFDHEDWIISGESTSVASKVAHFSSIIERNLGRQKQLRGHCCRGIEGANK